MTQEKEIKRPIQELEHAPIPKIEPLERKNTETNGKTNQALKTALTFADKIQRQPMIAHLIRAAERFNDRMGNQFGAAITYFSFLSMIPILMVSFAAAGFILASHPTLLQDIFSKILLNVSDPTLASTLKNTINTAVQQRTTVGLVGLAIALYSGINWMGNLREAIRAQSRDVWERTPQDQEKIWVKYLRDFVSLIGLLIALIVTLSITSIAGFRPADDYLCAVSRRHRMAEARLAADRPDHLYFRQLLAILLDFLAATASPTAQKSAHSRHVYRGTGV